MLKLNEAVRNCLASDGPKTERPGFPEAFAGHSLPPGVAEPCTLHLLASPSHEDPAKVLTFSHFVPLTTLPFDGLGMFSQNHVSARNEVRSI